MTEIVLSASNVSKNYVVYSSLFSRVISWFGFPRHPQSQFLATNDISFELPKGKALGVIGQNGAGKSTLLKLITGITRPTAGHIHSNGSISAILELGIGFSPDFTGRENVRHSAGLLGFSPGEIDEMIPRIISFAELGDFFDKPLRVYSSGMQARLAFSLATAKRPDILIVDEVLSVGDSYFQHKSFERIKEFRAKGTSILLVTHSLGVVRAICDRVILISKGAIIKEGMADEVIDYYNALVAEKENSKLSIEQRRQKNGWLYTEYGNGMAEVVEMELRNSETQEPVQLVAVGQEIEVTTKIEVKEPLKQLVLGHRISDKLGNTVWGTNTYHSKQVLENLMDGEVITTTLKFVCNLGPGSYSVSFGVHKDDTHLSECYHRADNRIVFDVFNADKQHFIGLSYLETEFTLERNLIHNV